MTEQITRNKITQTIKHHQEALLKLQAKHNQAYNQLTNLQHNPILKHITKTKQHKLNKKIKHIIDLSVSHVVEKERWERKHQHLTLLNANTTRHT